MIDQFDDLLKLANEQALKQHLFLVYTIAELPEDSTEEQRREFEQGHGGALVRRPVSTSAPRTSSRLQTWNTRRASLSLSGTFCLSRQWT